MRLSQLPPLCSSRPHPNAHCPAAIDRPLPTALLPMVRSSPKTPETVGTVAPAEILGKETGYFLGPNYQETTTFKWWV